jgi:hypothetical protein
MVKCIRQLHNYRGALQTGSSLSASFTAECGKKQYVVKGDERAHDSGTQLTYMVFDDVDKTLGKTMSNDNTFELS